MSHTEPGEASPDEVDGVALPVENLAADRGDLRADLELRDGFLDPLRVGLGVVVEEREELTRGVLCPEIAAARETEVLIGDDQTRSRNVGKRDAKLCLAVVSRTILHNENLEKIGGPVNVGQCAYTLQSVGGTPKVHDDDGDSSVF